VSELVRVEVEDGLGIIRLDRPKMNALNTQLQREIIAAAAEVTERDDIAAVIVYGGERVFAAGADIKEMADMTYSAMADNGVLLQQFSRAVAAIPKPTVAAITGFALGGGCELALMCDFRIAADNAKLGQPEMLLGVIPGFGGSQRLARLVGPSKAKDLIYSGRFVDAAEALDMGLVDQVVPAAEVLDAARAMMRQYVGGPRLALRAAKEAIDKGLEVDLETGLEIERHLFTGMFATKDRAIGMESFVENGPGKATFEGA
jgi:enoyl-CoA hydratase/carnithine racemase